MAVQTIVQGRPVRRPTFPLTGRALMSVHLRMILLTAKAHGLLDALHGLPANPAPFGRQATVYYRAYLGVLAR